MTLHVVVGWPVTCAVIFSTAPFSDEKDSGASVPTLQLTVLPVFEQLTGVQTKPLLLNEQLLPEALTNSVLLGSGSVTITPTADAGPKSPTPMLYVILLPVGAVSGVARFPIARLVGATTV